MMRNLGEQPGVTRPATALTPFPLKALTPCRCPEGTRPMRGRGEVRRPGASGRRREQPEDGSTGCRVSDVRQRSIMVERDGFEVVEGPER